MSYGSIGGIGKKSSGDDSAIAVASRLGNTAIGFASVQRAICFAAALALSHRGQNPVRYI